MTSQDKLGVSYIQLNNGLINCTHVGRFSHLPQLVNHYLILNVTLGCVLELRLRFRQGQLTTGSSNCDLDKSWLPTVK